MAPFPHRHSRFHFGFGCVLCVRGKILTKNLDKKQKQSTTRCVVAYQGEATRTPKKKPQPVLPLCFQTHTGLAHVLHNASSMPLFLVVGKQPTNLHQTTRQYPLWSFDRLLPPPSLHQPREINRCTEDGPFHTLPQIGLVFLPRPMDKIIFFDLDETFATPRTSRQPPPPTTN